MYSLKLKSDSTERTLKIGDTLSAFLSAGDVVCLEGELGTGKTVMVRGIARGLGFKGPVPSPTFTIIHTYPQIGLCHVDAFRLSDADDLMAVGVGEYLEGRWICALEWSDRVREAIPPDALTVTLRFGALDNERQIVIDTPGDWEKRLGEFDERIR